MNKGQFLLDRDRICDLKLQISDRRFRIGLKASKSDIRSHQSTIVKVSSLLEDLHRVSTIDFLEDLVVEDQAAERPVVAGEIPCVDVLVGGFQDPEREAVRVEAGAHVGPVDEAVLVLFV